MIFISTAWFYFSTPFLHSLEDGPISSPDDIVRDPDWAEERFRVDRKKLEALLSSDQAARIQQVSSETFGVICANGKTTVVGK